MRTDWREKEVTCPTCNGKFIARHPRAKFCSVYCKTKAHEPTVPKTCIGCGKTFMSKGKRQKFCSRSCSLTNSRPKRCVVCELCSKKFTHFGRGYRRYCEPCRKEMNKQWSKEYAQRRSRPVGAGSGGNQQGCNNHMSKGYTGPRNVVEYQVRGRELWGSTCACCGSTKGVLVHHIDWDRTNNADDNLVVLCCKCHRHVHSALGYMVDKDTLIQTLFHVWPKGRLKIAEKTGNPTSETGESEVKAVGNSQPAAETSE